MPTPKKKPAPKPDGIVAAAASAIKQAGDWKASVDFTLARHGKEIEGQRRGIEGLVAVRSEIHESLRSLSGHIREIRESIDHQRMAQNIILALIFGLIVAVSYLLTR